MFTPPGKPRYWGLSYLASMHPYMDVTIDRQFNNNVSDFCNSALKEKKYLDDRCGTVSHLFCEVEETVHVRHIIVLDVGTRCSTVPIASLD